VSRPRSARPAVCCAPAWLRPGVGSSRWIPRLGRSASGAGCGSARGRACRCVGSRRLAVGGRLGVAVRAVGWFGGWSGRRAGGGGCGRPGRGVRGCACSPRVLVAVSGGCCAPPNPPAGKKPRPGRKEFNSCRQLPLVATSNFPKSAWPSDRRKGRKGSPLRDPLPDTFARHGLCGRAEVSPRLGTRLLARYPVRPARLRSTLSTNRPEVESWNPSLRTKDVRRLGTRLTLMQTRSANRLSFAQPEPQPRSDPQPSACHQRASTTRGVARYAECRDQEHSSRRATS